MGKKKIKNKKKPKEKKKKKKKKKKKRAKHKTSQWSLCNEHFLTVTPRLNSAITGLLLYFRLIWLLITSKKKKENKAKGL